MRTRTWVIFILLNVIVSAGVVVAILFLWRQLHAPASSPPTPMSELRATGETTAPPTARPVVSPTPTGPLLYIVQEGDTLGAIADAYEVSIADLMSINGLTDPNLIYPGQTIVIPVGQLSYPTIEPMGEETAPAATPTSELFSTSLPAAVPTPLPTLTPSGPPLIEISQVLGSGNLEAEVVLIRNRGGTISLEGWSLSDAEGNVFFFPALTLFPDTNVRVHSMAGDDVPTDLYWDRSTPAWNGGELITLRDRTWSVVDTYVVP